MNDTPTPETDVQCYGNGTHPYVPTDFARKLERERDEANKELHQKYIEFDALFDEAEQIRINRDALRAEIESMRDDIKSALTLIERIKITLIHNI
jgi:beta-galactosidase beta subunit